MSTQLNLLILEDDPLDAELMLAVLEEAGYQCRWTRVENRAAFLAQLDDQDCDAVLADYNLPTFDGLSALHLFRQRFPDKPVILVSGMVGEETAIESLKAGATDYVLKDRLSRLGPVMNRALAEYQTRIAARQRTADLTLLNALNQAANRGESLQELIALLSAGVQHNFDCYGASIYILSEDKQYLEIQNYVLPPALRRRVEKLIGMGLPYVRLPVAAAPYFRQALEHGETQWIRDRERIRHLITAFIDASPLPATLTARLHRIARQSDRLLDIDEALATPLITKGKTIGILELSRRGAFAATDVQRLEIIAGQVTAIIHRKQIEMDVERLNRHRQLILHSAGEGILGLDREGRHTFVNPAAARMLGYEADELLGRKSHDLWRRQKKSGKRYPEAECQIIAAYKDGIVHRRRDEVFWRKDGSSFPVEYMSTPIEEKGELIGAVVTFRDISEQLQSAQEIARLGAVVEQAATTVLITDLAGNIVYANPYWETSTGYSVAEAIGQNPRLLKSGRQGPEFYKELWDTIGHGETWQGVIVNKRKDGTLYHEDAVITPVKDADGKIINYAAIKRDITDWVLAEEALHKLNAELDQRVRDRTQALDTLARYLKQERDRTQAILDALGEAVVVTDARGSIRYLNPAARALLDLQPDQGRYSLENSPELDALLAQIINGEIDLNGIQHQEVRLHHPDGRNYILSLSVTTLFDPDFADKISGYVAVGRDITTLKEAEQVKDRFVSNVSHELRTPLAVLTLLSGNLDTLYPRLNDDKRREMIRSIRAHARILNELIGDILELSRIDGGRISQRREAVDLGELAGEEVERQRTVAEKNNQQLEFTCEQTLVVHGHPKQLRQIVRNLVSNAIKYTQDGGRIVCSCAGLAATGRATADWPGSGALTPGEWAGVRVTDNGIGISSEDLPHIFDRFFRATEQGNIAGTGLGLSIARDLATANGGHMGMASKPGEGSTFCLFLPLHNRSGGE